MRIQHNIPSMNAYRNFSNNSKSINKNLEKLSSGYKINRAGDDAAGLAISEKMRAQITGLETAQKNAKDGISLIQTAEGALTEVHDMLNRMYKLAEQSANGTYDETVDRQQLQKEIVSLRKEIDRIGDSANFNGIALLDGTWSAAGGADDSAPTVTPTVTDTAGVLDSAAAPAFTPDAAASNDALNALSGKTVTVTYDGTNFNVSEDITGADYSVTFANAGGTTGTSFAASDVVTMTVEDASGNSVGSMNFTIGDGTSLNANDAATIALDVTTPDAGAAGAASGGEPTATVTNAAGGTSLASVNKIEWASGVSDADKEALNTAIDGGALNVVFTAADDEYTLTGTMGGVTDNTSIDGVTAVLQSGLQSADTTGTIDLQVNGTTVATVTLDLDAAAAGTAQSGGTNITDTLTFAAGSGSGSDSKSGTGLQLQVGDTSDSYNQMYISIDSIKSSNLGIYEVKTDANGTEYKELLKAGATSVDGKTVQTDDSGNVLTINNIDISDQDGAAKAMDVIKAAINYVSDTRGGLGAMQNRLEHTINNLSVMQENIQDAESTIRDTDVAEEMMKYTKNNILVQSAQAMLAQANQLPQGVLQLLQ